MTSSAGWGRIEICSRRRSAAAASVTAVSGRRGCGVRDGLQAVGDAPGVTDLLRELHRLADRPGCLVARAIRPAGVPRLDQGAARQVMAAEHLIDRLGARRGRWTRLSGPPALVRCRG